jgi:hypothetical protein
MANMAVIIFFVFFFTAGDFVVPIQCADNAKINYCIIPDSSFKQAYEWQFLVSNDGEGTLMEKLVFPD